MQIVEYLLRHIVWDRREIALAYRHVRGQQEGNVIKERLKEYSRVRFGKVYTYFALQTCWLSCCLPSQVVKINY